MKKVLFLAPSRKYAETVVKNLEDDLTRHSIDYSVWTPGHLLKVTSPNVELELVWWDPISWHSEHFRNRDAIFGQKDLVNKAREMMFAYNNFHKGSLLGYIRSCERDPAVDADEEVRTQYIPSIKNVYFNNPMTIVIWDDGTKTIVKCQDGDDYSEETGLALCISKKAFGNKGNFNDIFKKWCPEHKWTNPGIKQDANIDPKIAIEAANTYLDNIFDGVRKRIVEGFKK